MMIKNIVQHLWCSMELNCISRGHNLIILVKCAIQLHLFYFYGPVSPMTVASGSEWLEKSSCKRYLAKGCLFESHILARIRCTNYLLCVYIDSWILLTQKQLPAVVAKKVQKRPSVLDSPCLHSASMDASVDKLKLKNQIK